MSTVQKTTSSNNPMQEKLSSLPLPIPPPSTSTSTSSSLPSSSPSFSQTSQKVQFIRNLTNADVEKAALTMLDAFQEDALSQLLVCHVSDLEERKQLELSIYEAYIRQHIAKGIVLGQGEMEDKFETVSLWSHPKSVEQGLDSFSTLMEAGYDKVWRLAGPEGRDKIFKGMLPLLHDSCERIVHNDARFKGKGVFTLVYVGSTKEARGKGNLRKMFEYMFEKYIDVAGDEDHNNNNNNIAYLESSAPTNIPIYNKFGFHVVEDIVLGKKIAGAVEGQDYAVMNVMIRGPRGHDWTQDLSTNTSKL